MSIFEGKIAFIIGVIFASLMLIISALKGTVILDSMLRIPYYPMIILGLLVTILFWTNIQSIGALVKGFSGLINVSIFLYIGKSICRIYSRESFGKNLIYFSVIYAIYQIIIFLTNINSTTNLRSLRGDINGTPLFLVFVLILILYDQQLFNLLTKRKKCIFTGIISLSVFITLSRTTYIYFAISLLFLTLFSRNKEIMMKSIMNILIYIILAILFSLLIPSDIKQSFIEKFFNSIGEVSSRRDWNSLVTVVNNWRGFENFCAHNQYESYNLLHRLFGQGVAQGIFVGNFGYLVGIDNSQYLPYLHNSFYTLLIKTGVVGLVYYVAFFVGNALFLFSKIAKNVWYTLPVILCIGLMIVTMLAQGVVVAGNDSMLLILLGVTTSKKFLTSHEAI